MTEQIPISNGGIYAYVDAIRSRRSMDITVSGVVFRLTEAQMRINS